MSPRNEDFLFAQEAQRLGYVTEPQVEEGLLLQRRMAEELRLDERLAVILIKRGWIAEEQARRVYARIQPRGRQEQITGYRILERIGVGAMGTVYKALHLGLQRPVAVKILRRDLARDVTQVERLKEEAKILASIDHPNVVRALDAGEAGGFPYFVMEYVEGETLKQRIAESGPLPEEEALGIVRGLADALERARRAGVVHRDVKPGNVILSREGEPKLMDLGLAKGPVDLGLTQHGVTVGTPQFVSPEQAQDPRRADTRSDIYSLGATLYAMLTGRPPFHGSTLAEVLTKVLYETPPPVRMVNRKVSPEAGYLVERMMLKDPTLRYRTPADVVRDVDGILAGRSIVPKGFTGNWEAYLLRRRLRRWTKVGAAALAGALLLAAGVFALLRHQDRQRALENARGEIDRLLEETIVDPLTDDESSVRWKISRVADAVDRYRILDPPDLRRLRARLQDLRAHSEFFDSFERLLPEVRALATQDRFVEAVAVLVGLADRIPGTETPAERKIRARLADLRAASAMSLQRRIQRARTQAAASLEELATQQRAHLTALEGGLVLPSPELERATETARQAVDALERIEADLGALEMRFDEAALAPRLAALEFASIQEDLETGRDDLLRTVSLVWAGLEAQGWVQLATVQGHVKTRVAALEAAVAASVASHWERVMARVLGLHAQGESEAAAEELTRYLQAAGSHWPGLRAKALGLRRRIETEWGRRLEQASKRRDEVEAEVLALVRAGRFAPLLNRLDEVEAEVEATWPYRADLAAHRAVARGLEELQRRALEGLEKRGRVEEVRLGDGSVERRWTVVATAWDPEDPAVVVQTSRAAPSERRALAEIHPLQLLAWALPSEGPEEPLLQAVARLAALPVSAPADLRPLRDELREVVEAFSRAGVGDGLATWAEREWRRVEMLQAKREETARDHVARVNDAMPRQEYEDAHFWLSRLLEEGTLRRTDAFEQHAPRLASDMEKVEAELANARLATRLPGARIREQGAGETARTSVTLDFDSPVQMEVFRRPEARAVGVRERYEVQPPAAVTPGQSTSYRFHLLRGMEGIVRGLPLVLPCVFDPAETITVEFVLYTGESPFFLAVDVDGLQVGVLSADPRTPPYRDRWQLPPDLPALGGEEEAPRYAWFGRGRGVAFHVGIGFGDPRTWDWPEEGSARHHRKWEEGDEALAGPLFAFRPGSVHRVAVVRERGRLTLRVDGREVARAERAEWAERGRTSDRDRRIRATGTGRIQILTWTPVAIDDLRMTGAVLNAWRE